LFCECAETQGLQKHLFLIQMSAYPLKSSFQAANCITSQTKMFHHQKNKTDGLVPFHAKPKLKRKHASRANLDYDSTDEMDNDEESSNSSSSSSNSTEGSCISSSSSTFSIKKTHNGHKVLITEQKMSDALNHLQIDQNKAKSQIPIEQQDSQIEELEETTSAKSNRTIIDNLDDSDEFSDETVENGNIVVSNELKQKLREFKLEDFLMTNLNKIQQPNEIDSKAKSMQLMVWLPKNTFSKTDENSSKSSILSDSSSDSFTSTSVPNDENQTSSSAVKYKVEEPSDANSTKKSQLKRSFSQVNRISIEELKPNHINPFLIKKFGETKSKESDKNPSSVQFYLVDEDVDKKPNECISNKVNAGFNITELDNCEEEMEF
jgi:hypothetical protein